MVQSRRIQGTSICPGLARGTVHVIRARSQEAPTWSVPHEEIHGELGRLADAVSRAIAVLERSQALVTQETSEVDGQILAVHRMILQDPNAQREVEATIREQRLNAEAAVEILVKNYETKLERLSGNHERNFASDIRDPWRLVLEALLEGDQDQFLNGEARAVLAATELTPQVLTYLARERILGVITETGGRFSHGAVLARAMGIPTVTGLPNLLGRLEQGLEVLVDGGEGTVQLRPSESDVTEFEERRELTEVRRARLGESASLRAETTDGEEIDVRVNVSSVRDFGTFDATHTDGVGLLRTEFLYLERNEFPSEEEQYRLYRTMLEKVAPMPGTLRLLDIGGDKKLPYFHTPDEPNPALGWRGLRITLQWQDLLRVQLRALLRASVHGNARLLLPMVTSVEEILAVHEIFDGVRSDLIEQGYEVEEDIPVGVMVEVPSALLVLHHMLPHVDFVSVGSNDLVQYLLAADRDNPLVADLYDPHHPAVVHALSRVATMAREAGKPRSVCGDLAGDAAYTVLLLGLGFDSVSVSPHFVGDVKDAIRRVSAAEASELAARALSLRTSVDVRALLSEIRRGLSDQT